MAYLLDSDAFIRVRRLHYGFDFCPAYWDWLISAHLDGRVFSVEKVGEELRAGQDELSDWARERGGGFFKSPGADTIAALGRVAAWVLEQDYTPLAINTFMQVADYFLVAEALTGGHIVVTHEVTSASMRRIKIPDVCIGLGIGCLTPFEMLRRERARFVLAATP